MQIKNKPITNFNRTGYGYRHFMLYNLSICLSDLVDLPESKIKKASNGKVYLNCALWINDQENEHGSIGSVTVDKKLEDGKYEKKYIAYVRPMPKKDDEDSWKKHLAR